jgi:hypothetical protein
MKNNAETITTDEINERIPLFESAAATARDDARQDLKLEEEEEEKKIHSLFFFTSSDDYFLGTERECERETELREIMSKQLPHSMRINTNEINKQMRKENNIYFEKETISIFSILFVLQETHPRRFLNTTQAC